MNEALILAKRQDIMTQINVEVEAFTDDILPRIGANDFHIVCKLHDRIPNKLVLSWKWKRINKQMGKEFTFTVNETAEAFVNRVKAYLFDLTVMYINL